MIKSEYILIAKYQHAKHCKDGKRRSYYRYFLNDVEILRLKVPFETDYDFGHEHHTNVKDTYLLDGKIYQVRTKFGKSRKVHFPVSKVKLEKFGIPEGLQIFATQKVNSL